MKHIFLIAVLIAATLQAQSAPDGSRPAPEPTAPSAEHHHHSHRKDGSRWPSSVQPPVTAIVARHELRDSHRRT